MKRSYLFVAIGLILLLSINVFFIFRAKIILLNNQDNYLSKQNNACKNHIEQLLNQFEKDIDYINNYKVISVLFKDKSDLAINNFKLFYIKNKELLKEIKIYTSDGLTFNLKKDTGDNFIQSFGLTSKTKNLTEKKLIRFQEDQCFDNVPVFNDNRLYANILFVIDFENFIHYSFKHIEPTSKDWFALVDLNGKIVLSNTNEKSSLSKQENILRFLSAGSKGEVRNSLQIGDKKADIILYIQPLIFLDQKFGLISGIYTKGIFNKAFKGFIFPITISALIIFLLIGYLLYELLRHFRDHQTVSKSRTRLTEIVESLPIGVLVTDKNEKVLMANLAAINMLHMENLNELVGKNISNKLINAKNHISKDTREYNFDENKFVYYDKTGEEIVLYKRTIPLSYDTENLILEGFIDISPIEKARKLEIAGNNSKSEFLAKMSHEIRTPMNGIIGMTEVLSNQDLPAEAKEAIKIVQKSADLLLSIINDILDFSKIEAGKMLLEEVPFKLREELNITAALFRPKSLEKGVEMKIIVTDKVPDNIIGDPFRLRQVIANLLSNAVKFTPEGEIILSVEFIKESLGDLTLLFTVEDTGIGIPKENIDSIFGSYTQAEGSTSRKYGGTGLGTAIAKQLVELMNGEIWVESPSAISTNPRYPGAKFGFTIEVVSNEKLDKEYNFNHIRNFSEMKSLIISDNNDLLTTLVKATQSFGITTQITPFQKDTLDLIRKYPSTREDGFKIIYITDTYESDGYFVARKMFDKGLSDKFLTIMVSSNDKIGNFVKSKRLGVDYYLVKPFELSELFDIIQNNFPHVQIEDSLLESLDKLRKNLSILVAEDNLINQKVAQNIFKKLGYEIDIAKNGEEALVFVQEKKYDIIFMDLLMPIKSGIEATEELRKNGIDLPIVAMTADTSEEDKERARIAGMNEFVYKPVKTDAVKKVLIKWFSESSINTKI